MVQRRVQRISAARLLFARRMAFVPGNGFHNNQAQAQPQAPEVNGENNPDPDGANKGQNNLNPEPNEQPSPAIEGDNNHEE